MNEKDLITGAQPFSTSEGMLAFCLYQAGCEFADPNAICFHLYDPEILSKLGFKGKPLWASAQEAWKEVKRPGSGSKMRGHVEWSFRLTQRTHDLILAYRDQRKKLDEGEGRASDVVWDIMQSVAAGAMLPDEGILRVTCINLKLRAEFMDAWKHVVPLLRVPMKGAVKQFDTTVTVRGPKGPKNIPAKGMKKPGYKAISLNASEELKKKMGF